VSAHSLAATMHDQPPALAERAASPLPAAHVPGSAAAHHGHGSSGQLQGATREPVMTWLDRPATPPRSSRPRRRAGSVAVAVVFALTPWATLGFGTPVAFIAAAAVFSHWRRAHAVALWISAAVYTAVLAAEIVAAGTGTAAGATGAYVLIAVVGGGLQALFTVWVAATGETGPVRSAVRRRRAASARRPRPAGRVAARPGRTTSVIAILAVASLTGGGLYLMYADNFAAHHRTTTGTVTAVSAHQADCGEDCTSTEYDITVRYRPAGRRPVTFVSDGFDTPLAVGTRLPVYYVPAPNGYASLDTPSDKQDDGMFWIAVGLLLLFLLGLHLITAPPAGVDGSSADPGRRLRPWAR
jgi:hypothetical protein